MKQDVRMVMLNRRHKVRMNTLIHIKMFFFCFAILANISILKIFVIACYLVSHNYLINQLQIG